MRSKVNERSDELRPKSIGIDQKDAKNKTIIVLMGIMVFLIALGLASLKSRCDAVTHEFQTMKFQIEK